jgi:hypothetical protein
MEEEAKKSRDDEFLSSMPPSEPFFDFSLAEAHKHLNLMLVNISKCVAFLAKDMIVSLLCPCVPRIIDSVV